MSAPTLSSWILDLDMHFRDFVELQATGWGKFFCKAGRSKEKVLYLMHWEQHILLPWWIMQFQFVACFSKELGSLRCWWHNLFYFEHNAGLAYRHLSKDWQSWHQDSSLFWNESDTCQVSRFNSAQFLRAHLCVFALGNACTEHIGVWQNLYLDNYVQDRVAYQWHSHSIEPLASFPSTFIPKAAFSAGVSKQVCYVLSQVPMHL